MPTDPAGKESEIFELDLFTIVTEAYRYFKLLDEGFFIISIEVLELDEVGNEQLSIIKGDPP